VLGFHIRPFRPMPRKAAALRQGSLGDTPPGVDEPHTDHPVVLGIPNRHFGHSNQLIF
jgi:hypothetical protein